ncbi:hypothetical protein ES703_125647 [subsurface metagenome]
MTRHLFEKLWAEKKPGQQKQEYYYFLKWLWYYFKERAITNPTVVEIGIRRGAQKRFYEQLLGARHIGIDISATYGRADILGDSQAPFTVLRLGELLQMKTGRARCDLVFIDGDHSLRGVRRDYELYKDLAPLIAIHDIYCTRKDVAVLDFWGSLNRYKMMDRSFIEFFSPEPPDHYGIGVIESLLL